jgi:hypothetical protein
MRACFRLSRPVVNQPCNLGSTLYAHGHRIQLTRAPNKLCTAPHRTAPHRTAPNRPSRLRARLRRTRTGRRRVRRAHVTAPAEFGWRFLSGEEKKTRWIDLIQLLHGSSSAALTFGVRSPFSPLACGLR